MILIDLEIVLIDFRRRLEGAGIYLPGSLITTDRSFFIFDDNQLDNIKNSSIFSILLLDYRNISFVHTYKQIIWKEVLTQPIYETIYIPDANGDNILNLTSNDIDFLNELNNNLTLSTVPDSEFLKIIYDPSLTPTTSLAKIIKFKLMVDQYIQNISSPISYIP